MCPRYADNPNLMDIPVDNELLEAILAGIRRLGIAINVEVSRPDTGGHHADALVQIGHCGRVRTYAARMAKGLRPVTLGATLHQIERFDHPGLLMADHVTPPMAETLKARGVAFVDAAGNAYINQPPMFVWVKGERPRHRMTAGWARGRVFRPGGLKVVFTLLCHPEWTDRPYREIAVRAGVAHGTVGDVVAELQKLRFIATVNGKRRLLQPERLLRQWAEAFARTLRPRLLLGRYRAAPGRWWTEFSLAEYGMLLGGEPAAEKLTRYLRPGTVTLYGDKVDSRLLLDFKLHPDPDGSVEFVKRFWAFETHDDRLVPLPLIYADLLMIGDARCLETADLIYERIIDGFVG